MGDYAPTCEGWERLRVLGSGCEEEGKIVVSEDFLKCLSKRAWNFKLKNMLKQRKALAYLKIVIESSAPHLTF